MKKYSKSLFLLLGALATIVYTLHVVIGGLLWQNYSHLQQPISDLTATGAPDRKLLLVFTTVYGLMALIFAISFTFWKVENIPGMFSGVEFVLYYCIWFLLFTGCFPKTWQVKRQHFQAPCI